MSTIQLSSSSSSVQNAASRELRIFVIYVIWLGFAAIATAFLTVLVWRSNSATHAVAREDAKARIEEAKFEAAQANERAQKLENDNLKLGGQVVGLQRDASDAKSVQQRVEKELAVQQERAAKAEKELIEIEAQSSGSQYKSRAKRCDAKSITHQTTGTHISCSRFLLAAEKQWNMEPK
jgi:hypothetical protein